MILPQAALPWWRQILGDATQLQSIAKPKWSHHQSRHFVEAHLLSNPKRSFIQLVKFLPDGRTASICIPEGNRQAGWSLFEHQLVSVSAIWFSGPSQKHSEEHSLADSFNIGPSCSRAFSQATNNPSFHDSQIPPSHLTPKPWSNTQESLKLFSHDYRSKKRYTIRKGPQILLLKLLQQRAYTIRKRP